MAGVQLEGLVEGLVPKQSEFIKGELEKLGFSGGKIVLERVGKVGDNFATDVRRIIAEKDGKTLKLIAKIASSMPELRMAMNVDLIYRNENNMYTEILPKFRELEEAAGVPESERLKYAKCYGSFVGEPCEVILLEDLAVYGYKMQDKMKSLADNDVRLILKNLASLHSLSYALKHQEPETFNSLNGKLFNMWKNLVGIEMAEANFLKLETEVCQMVQEEKYQNELRGRVRNMAELLSNTFNEEEDQKYKIIQQGDCWTNNFLFLNEDDKATQCCMIDYQMSCLTVPVTDIGYMIFNCTDHESRMKHYHDWLDYYHEQLEKYLSYYKLNADIVYSKERLHADMKRNGQVTLAQGVLIASIILRESGDAQAVKTALTEHNEGDNIMDNMAEAISVNTMKIETLMRFKARIEQLVDSHLELKLL